MHFPGKTVFVETTTLVDDLRRVRSVQWFDEDTGAFKRLYLMKEQRCVCWCSVADVTGILTHFLARRVIDSVSGAVSASPGRPLNGSR